MIDHTAHAKAIETLYDCSMTVYEVTEQPVNGAPRFIKNRQESESVLYKDVPCFVSYESVGVVVGDMPTTTQSITLLCSDSLNIPEGSTIDIIKGGRLKRFRSSGVADHLISHQEIALTTVDYAKG